MKKQVLLSVFAAALFAAPAASAVEISLPNTAGGTQADTNAPATFESLKPAADKNLGDKSEKATKDANKLKKGEVLKVEKGAKVPAKKVLPKTSAVK